MLGAFGLLIALSAARPVATGKVFASATKASSEGTSSLATATAHAESRNVQSEAIEQDSQSQNTRPISGLVLDESGTPVSEATVIAKVWQGHDMDGVRASADVLATETGADGRFQFTVTKTTERGISVLAYKNGFALNIVGLRPPILEPVDLVLEPSAPFVGVVQDQEGRPIEGARILINSVRSTDESVTAGRQKNQRGPVGRVVMYPSHPLQTSSEHTPLEGLFSVLSDADGKFEFSALPLGTELALGAKAKGFGSLSSMESEQWNKVFQRGTPEAPAKLVLLPEAKVVGRIVTELKDVPVASLRVFLQGSGLRSHHLFGEAVTDESGRFEIRGFPKGTGNVMLWHEPEDRRWTYRAVADAELRPGETTEVEIELIEGITVDGRVIDSEHETPIRGVLVATYGPMRPRSGAACASTKTDDDGHYHFRLPPGETYFYVMGAAPGYTVTHGSPESSQTVTITSDARSFEGPTLRMDPAAALHGRIEDAHGRPVAGAKIVAACDDFG
jgi:protocatechuate 3,4-dioxygenase beta subunit